MFKALWSLAISCGQLRTLGFRVRSAWRRDRGL